MHARVLPVDIPQRGHLGDEPHFVPTQQLPVPRVAVVELLHAAAPTWVCGAAVFRESENALCCVFIENRLRSVQRGGADDVWIERRWRWNNPRHGGDGGVAPQRTRGRRHNYLKKKERQEDDGDDRNRRKERGGEKTTAGECNEGRVETRASERVSVPHLSISSGVSTARSSVAIRVPPSNNKKDPDGPAR